MSQWQESYEVNLAKNFLPFGGPLSVTFHPLTFTLLLGEALHLFLLNLQLELHSIGKSLFPTVIVSE